MPPKPRIYSEEELRQRFMDLVKINEAGCWMWQGSLNRSGYGTFNHHGITISAHRYSWAMANGGLDKLIEGKCVCHKCNIPGCVNPEHLYQGSYDDNAQDRIRAGHRQKIMGSKSWNTKITEDDARDIKFNCDLGSIKSIVGFMIKYDIHEHVIAGIVKGKSWVHVTKEQ